MGVLSAILGKLVHEVPPAVAGAIAGHDKKKPKPKVTLGHIGKHVVKDIATAPASFAKETTDALIDGLLGIIPGYRLIQMSAKNVSNYVKRMEAKAIREKQAIEKRLKDAEKEKKKNEKSKKVKPTTELKLEPEKLTPKEKEAIEDPVKSKETKKLAVETIEKIRETSLLRYKRLNEIVGNIEPRVASLETQMVEVSKGMLGLSVLLSDTTSQIEKITLENIASAERVEKVADKLAIIKKEGEIAELQKKENTFEASHMLAALNDNFQIANDNAPKEEESGSIIKGILGGLISDAMIGFGGVVMGLLPEAFGLLMSPIALSILGVVGMAFSAMEIIDEFKIGEDGVSKGRKLLDDLKLQFENPANVVSEKIDRNVDITQNILPKLQEQQATAPDKTQYQGYGKAGGGVSQYGKDTYADQIKKYQAELNYNNSVIDDAMNKDPSLKGSGTATNKAIYLSEEDKKALARVVYYEARGEGPDGQAAVIWTVLNRVELAKQTGDPGLFKADNATVQGILNTNQYDPIVQYTALAEGKQPDRNADLNWDWHNLPEIPASDEAAYIDLINKIVSGKLADPTKGATFYQNVKTSGSSFNQDAITTQIGNHTFYDAHAFNNYKIKGTPDAFSVNNMPSVPEPASAPAPIESAPMDDTPMAGPPASIIVVPLPPMDTAKPAPAQKEDQLSMDANTRNPDASYNASVNRMKKRSLG